MDSTTTTTTKIKPSSPREFFHKLYGHLEDPKVPTSSSSKFVSTIKNTRLTWNLKWYKLSASLASKTDQDLSTLSVFQTSLISGNNVARLDKSEDLVVPVPILATPLPFLLPPESQLAAAAAGLSAFCEYIAISAIY